MNAAFMFILPAIIISGFGTPVSSMPVFFQHLSYLNPQRHIMVILRSVYLKGSGLDVLWPNVAVMAGLALVLLSVSVLRFEKSLE